MQIKFIDIYEGNLIMNDEILNCSFDRDKNMYEKNKNSINNFYFSRNNFIALIKNLTIPFFSSK